MGARVQAIRAAIVTTLGLMMAGAHAAPMTPDPTGMWYDPAQPGWGMSLTQQGETIFAVLFVYDANHNPQWFVASNVVDTGQVMNMLVGEVYSGPLYRTTGPAYAVPSDPATLSATPVGTIQIAYVQPTNNISLAYSVNGTTVTKTVQAQTWGSNAAQLAGSFNGAILIGSTMSCQAPAPLQQVSNFTISQGAAPGTLNVTWGSGIDVGCMMTGTYAQQGQFGTLTGPVMCGPIPNLIANVGTLTITQMTIAPTGFSGYLNYTSPMVNGSSCTVGGTIGGVKVVQ